MMVVKGTPCLLLICLFMLSDGHPLDNGKPAFDHIDKANKDLPDVIQMMLREGDIMSPQGGALDKKYGQWPSGYVPYTISSSFSSTEKSTIRSAVQDIMDAAPCLTFREYTYRSTNVPTDHIEVIKSGGCWSMVGKTGGKQSLSLGNGCVYSGTIIHEFLHAIGFYHEQSRPDRDQFVRINWGNIRAGREHNFQIAKNINSLGVDYDEASVMHYSNNAFSNGNGPTLVWKANPTIRLGSNALSDKDILQINLKYCGDVTTTKTTKTKPSPTTPTKTTTTKSSTTTTSTLPPTTTSTTTTQSPTTTTSTSTTRSTTTGTIKPPTEVCGDKKGSCISIQFLRYGCNSGQKSICPRSCEVCTGPKSNMCLNFKDKSSRSCMRRAERGHCQHRRTYLRWRMKINCPKTCCERGELYKYPKN